MYGQRQSSGVTFLFPIFAIALVAVVCWYLFLRSTGDAGHGVIRPGPLDTPSKAQPMLLRQLQLGDEFSQSAQESRSTTRSELTRGAPRPAAAAVRAGWIAGAQAAYYQTSGPIEVWSGAQMFTTPQQAEAYEPELVSRWEAKYRGHQQVAPAGTPGDDPRIVLGRRVDPRYLAAYPDRGRRVVVLTWRHDAILAWVVVSAQPSDGPGDLAGTLAKDQDGNIAFALR
jgi:hypothetical protein